MKALKFISIVGCLINILFGFIMICANEQISPINIVIPWFIVLFWCAIARVD